MKQKLIAILLSVLLAVSITACGGQAEPAPQVNTPLSRTALNYLDTVISITLYDGQSESVLDGCVDLIAKYENLLSKTVEGSDVWNINHAAGQPVAISDETAAVIRSGLYYGEISGGAFDISIGPVSALWNFKAENPQVPDAGALAQAVSLVDYRKVKLEGNTVTLADPNMQLDLGGIAKGYIADKLAEYLKKNNVTSAIINLGGNVYALGSKSGSSWSVGIQDPFGRSQSPVAAVKVENKSVVTSGIYERYFQIGDEFYHHIIDPKTGMSVRNELTSVTIISDHSIDGDALSTSCYVLGINEGKALIESLEGVEAIFVDEYERVSYTSGIYIPENDPDGQGIPLTLAKSAAN